MVGAWLLQPSVWRCCKSVFHSMNIGSQWYGITGFMSPLFLFSYHGGPFLRNYMYITKFVMKSSKRSNISNLLTHTQTLALFFLCSLVCSPGMCVCVCVCVLHDGIVIRNHSILCYSICSVECFDKYWCTKWACHSRHSHPYYRMLSNKCDFVIYAVQVWVASDTLFVTKIAKTMICSCLYVIQYCNLQPALKLAILFRSKIHPYYDVYIIMEYMATSTSVEEMLIIHGQFKLDYDLLFWSCHIPPFVLDLLLTHHTIFWYFNEHILKRAYFT